MKQATIDKAYAELINRKQELHPKWIKYIPKEIPKQINFQKLQKENYNNIVSYTVTKTLHKSLKPQFIQREKVQNNPIILVFCQPGQQLGKPFPYVPASYCSWIQSSGAKCIPLAYNLNQATMQYLIQNTNGLLVPGGNSNLYKNYETKQGMGQVTIGFKKVWRLVTKLWSKGIRYPIWGTCLGLQLVLLMISNDMKVLSTLNSRNHTLEIYSDYDNSIIFKNMPIHMRVNIQNEKLLNFFHRHGISLNRFLFNQKYEDLRKELKLISASKDRDGNWFCSFLQGRNNPIFLSQFHSEKQAYQWNSNAVINHSYQAIQISQYFANQFVQECRKCKNKFPSKQQQSYYMIYQYIPQFEYEKHFQLYYIDIKFRKNKDLKNPRVNKKNKSQFPIVANKTKSNIEDEQKA